jgi:hypothetical protein
MNFIRRRGNRIDSLQMIVRTERENAAPPTVPFCTHQTTLAKIQFSKCVEAMTSGATRYGPEVPTFIRSVVIESSSG